MYLEDGKDKWKCLKCKSAYSDEELEGEEEFE